jgi:acyl-CoA synthetase (AMP-forming)/AMP-acid ligase II
MDVTSPSTLTATALNDACNRIKATMVFASPAALANVLKTASGSLPALASVATVMSAGAPVPIETLRQISRLCPHARLHTPYGMTEALPVADISLEEREHVGEGRGVCVGRVVANADVIISSYHLQAVSPLEVGVTGEVLVRAPWLSDGYDALWFTQSLARTDGWHRTGDVGHLDHENNLWIEGRVVHVIHTPFGDVTPVPLEIAAETIHGVERAAAVAVGAPGVQQVVIVVEITSGEDGPATRELATAVRAAVAPQAVAAVFTTKKLPVDIRHNSKIDRTAFGRDMAHILSGSSR